MYVTMFCFSIDAAGIAAITGSIAHLLSDGSFTFFHVLVFFCGVSQTWVCLKLMANLVRFQ